MCVFVLTGCQADPASLLTLPRTPEQRELLSEQAVRLLSGKASYLTPAAGDLSGSVGSVDFDGDGTDELVSCLLWDGDPCVEIYRQVENDWSLITRITGEGSGIAAIYFLSLDVAGTRGIVISWQLEDAALHGLTVCAYYENQFEVLHSGSAHMVFCADLDRDGCDEILTLSPRTDDAWQAIMLYYRSGGLRSAEPVSLSQGLCPENVTIANIGFDRAALLCEGFVEHYGYLTDVIVSSDGKLTSIYLSDLTGVSDLTAREIPLFCADVNNDGTVELPRSRIVTEVTDTGDTAEATLIDWYRCDEFSEPIDLYTTYHNIEEGWYFRLPDRMRYSVLPVTGVQTETVSSTLFYFLSGEGQRGKALWEVYVLTGDDAEQTEETCALRRLAAANGRLYSLRHHSSVGSYYTSKSLPQHFSLLEKNAVPGAPRTVSSPIL